MGLLAEHYSYLAWRFRPDKLEGLWRRCKSLFPFLGVRVFFISLGYFLKCYNFPRCVSQRFFFCIRERYLCMTFNVFSRFLLVLVFLLYIPFSFCFFSFSPDLRCCSCMHWALTTAAMKHQLHSQSRLLHIIIVSTYFLLYVHVPTLTTVRLDLYI